MHSAGTLSVHTPPSQHASHCAAPLHSDPTPPGTPFAAWHAPTVRSAHVPSGWQHASGCGHGGATLLHNEFSPCTHNNARE